MTMLCLQVESFARFVLYMHAARAAQPEQEHPLHSTIAYANLVQGKDHALCLVVYHSFKTWMRTVVL